MPDYNAAVAAGIQPPAPVQQQNFGQTLSTVADFQRAQAATQLSQAQALQTQRKYNGLMAFGQSLSRDGNPQTAYQALVAAGGDPADAKTGLDAFAQAQYMRGHNNMDSPTFAANASGLSSLASAAKTQAGIPGEIAGSDSKIADLAAQHANQYIANPTQANWDDNVALTKKYKGPLAAAQLDNIKDQDQRMALMKGHVGGGLTADQAKPQAIPAGSNILSPTDYLAGRGAVNPTATSAGGPAGAAVNTIGSNKVQELAAERSDKTYSGIQAQAAQYGHDKPYIDLAQSVLSNPAMYSGTGANAVLNLNKIKAVFGDTKSAMLQEALEKVTASNVLGQLNQQKDQMQEAGGTSSRVFAPMVDLVAKTSASLGNTLAGNRFLVEVMDRTGALGTKVRDMAADYKASHGGMLDAGFDKSLSEHLRGNPIFTKQEMTHPELLGSPSAPAGLNDTQSRRAWGQGMGLNPGDPFRVNGQYKYWGGAPAQ